MIEYAIITSARAKHASLRVSPIGEIQFVIPKHNRSRIDVDALVQKNSSWLIATQKRISANRKVHPDADRLEPLRLDLALTNQSFTICYLSGATKKCVKTGIDCVDRLNVFYINHQEIGELLQTWLKRQAVEILNPLVAKLSEETGLLYSGLTVRNQKTRWGSCSSRQRININRNLLFLSPDLVRYLIIHELCHTKHMNHSNKFWSLVGQFEPRYRELDRALNKAHNYIPLWALK